jgi:hypothetical protein
MCVGDERMTEALGAFAVGLAIAVYFPIAFAKDPHGGGGMGGKITDATREVANSAANNLSGIAHQCQKTLSIHVTWEYVCSEGAVSGPTPVEGSAGEPPDETCEFVDTKTHHECAAPNTGPSVDALGNEVCTAPLNNRIPSAAVTVIEVRIELATPVAIVTDRWDNRCASLEALVRPGHLFSDGKAATIVTEEDASTSITSCFRVNSVCSDAAPKTRVINFLPITRTCWQWTNTFNCVSADNPSSR